MGWIIAFSLLLLLLLGLLFIPIRLILHSGKQDYRLEAGHLIRGKIVPTPDDLIVVLRIVFWKKEWSLPDMLVRKKFQKTEKAAPQAKRKKKKNRKYWKLSRIRSIVRSFRIRRFYLNIDTDDYLLNAWLWPVFFFLNRFTKKKLAINFSGDVEIDLCIENRPIWILAALLRR